jgi:GrpB-like predicted nucleotidyltransferase (UPF0157 family)
MINDGTIFLKDYTPNWAILAAQEITLISENIPCNIIEKIEHIGSTSVKGCKSQPIIDIAVQVAMLENGKLATFPLQSLDYAYWKENPDKSSMFFLKAKSEREDILAYHLHFFEADKFNKFVNFRNLLRGNAKILENYQNLKIKLANESSRDCDIYTNTKAEFINKALSL